MPKVFHSTYCTYDVKNQTGEDETMWCYESSVLQRFLLFDSIPCFMYNIFGGALQTRKAPPYHMNWDTCLPLNLSTIYPHAG